MKNFERIQWFARLIKENPDKVDGLLRIFELEAVAEHVGDTAKQLDAFAKDMVEQKMSAGRPDGELRDKYGSECAYKIAKGMRAECAASSMLDGTRISLENPGLFGIVMKDRPPARRPISEKLEPVGEVIAYPNAGKVVN